VLFTASVAHHWLKPFETARFTVITCWNSFLNLKTTWSYYFVRLHISALLISTIFASLHKKDKIILFVGLEECCFYASKSCEHKRWRFSRYLDSLKLMNHDEWRHRQMWYLNPGLGRDCLQPQENSSKNMSNVFINVNGKRVHFSSVLFGHKFYVKQEKEVLF